MNTAWKKGMIADVVNLVIGLGLFASPWAFGFHQMSPVSSVPPTSMPGHRPCLPRDVRGDNGVPPITGAL